MLPAIEEVIDETIEEVIDDMFPPLRGLADDNEDFARKDSPEYQVEGVAAARQSSGSDMDNDNEFDEVDSGRNNYGNKVGGAMSTNMEACLILRRFWSKQASLTSPPSLSAKTTDKGRSYFSASDEDNNYPEDDPTEGLYDDDELFQDDKEEDLDDLSYFCSDAKSSVGSGVGRKLYKGGPPKPDVTNMSTLEATMVLNQWKVEWKAYTDKLQR